MLRLQVPLLLSMIHVFSLKPKASHIVLPEALSVFFRPREKGSTSMNAVDIDRLAQPSRQTQCGLARDHCLGQLFGIQGEL